MRRFLACLALLFLAVGLWIFRPWAEQGKSNAALPGGEKTPARQSVAVAPMSRPRSEAAGSPASASSEAPSPLADELNSPAGDIHRDLMILQDIFIAWRTNYPHDGNPVGENSEITAALTGRNSLQLALIPINHPAINASGELCDRWGTPFVFHQLSGTRMEIRSAGPDRKLYTPDDAVLTP